MEDGSSEVEVVAVPAVLSSCSCLVLSCLVILLANSLTAPRPENPSGRGIGLLPARLFPAPASPAHENPMPTLLASGIVPADGVDGTGRWVKNRTCVFIDGCN